MKDLDGKTAFITGAASGIGLGMAKALLGAGMKVVIADVRAGPLQAAVKSLGAPSRALAMPRPMPLAAPVTKAVLPSRFSI